MKAVLFALFISLLMVGCGQEPGKKEISPKSYHSPDETAPLSTIESGDQELHDSTFLRISKPVLPMVLNEDTVWVDQIQSKDGSVLTYIYEMPYDKNHYTTANVDLESVIAVAKSCIAGELAHLSEQQTSKNDSTIKALLQGMTFHYVYNDTEGNLIYDLNITREDVFTTKY